MIWLLQEVNWIAPVRSILFLVQTFPPFSKPATDAKQAKQSGVSQHYLIASRNANPGNVGPPGIDALVARGASLHEIDARKAVYDELNAIVLDEAWYLPLLYGANYAAAPRKVRNLDRLMGSDGKMNLSWIWLSE